MQRLFTMPAGGRIGPGDLFASLVLTAFACLATLLLLQHQITEFRWEQAARAAFYARMPAPVNIPPLFDFPARDRSIIEGALDIVAFIVDVSVVRQVRARICRVEAWLASWHPKAASRERAELQSGQSVDQPSDILSVEGGGHSDLERRREFDWHAIAYEGFRDNRSSTLRASAEACFRLAESGVSHSLAAELEGLGKEFTREAEEIESRSHATASV